MDDKPTQLKLVVCGDGAVGKTCLLAAYVREQFSEDHIPTVFDSETKDVCVDGKHYALGLWDTAGQDDYKRLRPLSYPGTDVFIVCFDLTDRLSFEHVATSWVPEIRHHLQGCSFVLVGTKSDLRDDAAFVAKMAKEGRVVVAQSDAAELAKSLGAAAYVETSAKLRRGLDDAFTAAVREGARRRHATGATGTRRTRRCSIL